MKNNRATLPLLTIALLAGACLSSTAQSAANQKIGSDWGTAPGLRSPHPDSKGRSGHWWWPDSSRQSTEKVDHIGNRGRVFGNWKASESSNAPVPPEPPEWAPGQVISCGPSFLLNNIIFLSDSAALSKEGKAEADKLIGEMKKFTHDTVVCVGHTDDVGPETYNQQLGLRRAQAVVDYMIHSGIEPNRLRAESKGESEPAVPNNTPANRALNRRVVFEIKMGK